MSLFFDPTKKLAAARTSDSAGLSVGSNSEKPDKGPRLDQIPVDEVQLHPGTRIVLHTDPVSPGADRFRYLKMCLRELWHSGKLKSLLITSPLPQDGKSTITLNLATALAEGGKRTVLVIEADLHHPTLTEQLGLEMRPGLAECLANGMSAISGVRRLEPLGWYLLPAGHPHENPTELLQTDALAGVMQKLSQYFDWVIIDSPPVVPLTDALSLARQTSATLLVVREGRTPDDAVEKSIALLGRQRVLGIVLNGVDGLDRLYSGYYGYGYSRGPYSREAAERRLREAPARKILVKHSLLESRDEP
jgi:capsular exopolysaccharide synthesis family protein